MKKLAVLLILASAGYLCYLTMGHPAKDLDDGPSERIAPFASRPPRSAPAVSVSPPSGLECGDANVNVLVQPNSVFQGNVEKELNAAIAAGGQRLMAGTSNLAKKMAAFTLAMKCSPAGANADLSFVSTDALMRITPDVCAAIPMLDVNTPLNLIQNEPIGDAPEVMLAVAKNALVQAKYLEYSDAPPKQVRYYLNLSEQFGRRAAATGLEPAMMFMAEQYDTGGFGRVELVKAYIYAKQIVTASHGEKGKAGMDYFYSKMTKSQFDLAEITLRRCERLASGVSIPASPPGGH